MGTQYFQQILQLMMNIRSELNQQNQDLDKVRQQLWSDQQR